MEFPTSIILQWIATYFWPYVRISVMLMVLTAFGAKFVSSRIRLYWGLARTIAIMPAVPAVPNDIEIFSLQGVLITTQQIVIGISIGIITQFVTQTFILVGQIIGMQSSLGFASMADPVNGQSSPVLGQLFMFLVTLFFLAIDGHLHLIQLVAYSFKSIPIGQVSFNTEDFKDIALWFGLMFKTALSISLSSIIALLTVNLSFGVMTRAAPQINIFSLGFAFALLTGLFLCWFLLLDLFRHYDAYWQVGEAQICKLIKIDC